MRQMKYLLIITILGLLYVPTVLAQEVVTLMTHDSFSISEETLTKFESQTGIKVRLLKGEDAIDSLKKAVQAKEKPIGDVFYGADNTIFSKALAADIFVPYSSPLLVDIKEGLKFDPQNRLLPVDYGDVCLNYDKKWFKQKGLAPPQGLEDLIKPEYKGVTVVQDPAKSSPGLAFLLATISRFGQDGFQDYWKKLKANGVVVVDGWEDAYYNHFALSGGDRPIVVSYATSPPAEVFFSDKSLEEAPSGVVVENGSAFRQVEFVGILRGCANPEGAKKLVDFMLGVTFQEDIPLNMFVFPANQKAKLPEVFVKHSQEAEHPAAVSYEDIARHQDKWVQEWAAIMHGN